MSIYSKRFIGVAGATSSVSATVPTGVVWIVRDVDLVAVSALPVHAGFRGNDGQFIYYIQIESGSTELWSGWRGRQVLIAGETLTLQVFAGSVDATISGYELTAS